jgi:hypothetical protein
VGTLRPGTEEHAGERGCWGEYQLWPRLLACQLPGPQGLEATGAEPSDVTLPPSPRPLPKHLHTPGSNGRYSTIQCRISHSSLTSLLRDWSSFVLVEGYSYVKLLSRWAEWSTPHPSLFLRPQTVFLLLKPIYYSSLASISLQCPRPAPILLLHGPHHFQDPLHGSSPGVSNWHTSPGPA